jgi:uncharacterized protein (TIGR00369 family)
MGLAAQLGGPHLGTHRAARNDDLTVKGEVVRMGSQFSVAEARVFDAGGKLLASGRGTYYTPPPKT